MCVFLLWMDGQMVVVCGILPHITHTLSPHAGATVRVFASVCVLGAREPHQNHMHKPRVDPARIRVDHAVQVAAHVHTWMITLRAHNQPIGMRIETLTHSNMRLYSI